MKQLQASDFMNKAKTLPVIDVRTPAEFAKGHIPGAHNIPLFTNAERAVVGTAYKQESRQEAILKGLDFIGPKMRDFVEESRKLAVKNQVLVHCWRGGMRSSSFAWLLQTTGLKPETLEGGYKAYRRLALRSFRSPAKIIILGGETGSGKTEILRELKSLGEQVIDLEALAHHKGSVFGHIAQPPQPTTEQFQNNLFDVFNQFDPKVRIWLEDESYCIGKVNIPEAFWMQMKKAPLVTVHMPKAVRIQRLLKEYGHADTQESRQAIVKIQQQLGGLAYKEALAALENGNLTLVADLLLTYYDKSYQFGIGQRNPEAVFHIQCEEDNARQSAMKIRDLISNQTVF